MADKPLIRDIHDFYKTYGVEYAPAMIEKFQEAGGIIVQFSLEMKMDDKHFESLGITKKDSNE